MVARAQMKTYMNTNDLARKQVQPGTKSRNDRNATFGNGRSHPPRNSVVATEETTIMFAYSARKNSANRMPLYSVWDPPVSSWSASGRSNGARLVAARPPMKKIRNASGWTNANHTDALDYA